MPQRRRTQTLWSSEAVAFASNNESSDPVLVPDGHQVVVLTVENGANLGLAATNELDVVLETTFNEGRDWEEIANVHWDNTEDGTAPTHQCTFDGRNFTPTGNITPGATLADNAVKTTVPLGEQLRVTANFTIAGTATLTVTVMTVM